METVPDILNAPITIIQNIITAPITMGGLPGPEGPIGPVGVITISQDAPEDPVDQAIWIEIL